MGQGIMIGIAMILAEELDADWSRVKAEFAPADPAYYNPMFGRQATGGSTAVRAPTGPLCAPPGQPPGSCCCKRRRNSGRSSGALAMPATAGWSTTPAATS